VPRGLRSHLPDWALEKSFLLENWQWGGLLLVVLLGYVIDKIAYLVLVSGIGRTLRRAGIEVERATLRHVFKPAGTLAMALFWLLGIRLLDLPENAFAILNFAATFVAAAAGVWSAYRLVDIFRDAMAHRARRTATKFDDLLVPLVSKSAKVFIAAFGLVFVAGNLNIDISSLLAGLGLGGLAFALAAKDTVSNLFGTLTVILDRTFQVGDWVVIGDVEGTVERVGFRSTRIRTFYNSLITVPNGTLLTQAVDNMGARRYRRWKTMISITYETPPKKIEAFCEGIRELIRTHPYTRKDYFHVYLNAFAASSLDILLYVFHATPDWATELRERHRLFLDILRLADRLGVDFAFPTQTLYLNRSQDGARTPEPYPSADQVLEAERAGRTEARGLIDDTLMKRPKPPPVDLSVSTRDNRGESDGDGDGGE
jgi:MscS family membrane protein